MNPFYALLDARGIAFDAIVRLVLDAKHRDGSIDGLHSAVRVYARLDRRVAEHLAGSQPQS
jgi:hypothetical protein